MTTGAKIRVFSPIGEVRKKEMSHRLAPRAADLNGKTIGFLHNEKGWASDTFFEHDTEILHEMLQQRFKLKGAGVGVGHLLRARYGDIARDASAAVQAQGRRAPDQAAALTRGPEGDH